MRKVIFAVGAVAVILVVLVAARISLQDSALDGPPQGSAVIESEAVNLSARLGARVLRVSTQEGGTTEAGGTILELDCDEPTARLAEAEARLAATRSQADGAAAQALAAKGQSRAVWASTGAVSEEIAALTARRDIATREAERLESMGVHAPLARRDQARSTATSLEAQLRAALANKTASTGRASSAKSQASAASAQARAAHQQIAAMEAIVRTAKIAVRECRIYAPRAGIVQRIFYEPGELVMPGSLVARIVDPNLVTATFYLPNRDFEAARVGASANVTADTYADRTFAATVKRVGLEAEFTPRNIQTRSDRDRLVYPIEVSIPNPDGLLRSGMTVTVTLQESGK